MAVNDDSMVKIMQSLGLDYNPAISSTLKFEESIARLNKQLFEMKNLALQGAKDINLVFSSQLGGPQASKNILDQFGKPLRTIREEAEGTAGAFGKTTKQIKASTLATMEAQAASIQQRIATKGLSDEYSKQAGLLRSQLNELQQRLQLEGKLSAEETKQTVQLKEQLSVLQAQTRVGIADNTRTNPNIMANEFQRRSSWFLTGAMFYGTINAAKEATRIIKDVEMGMIDIQRVMNDSTFVFNEYRDQLMQLGVQYGQTFDTVQEITLRWAQAGYNAADSLELTKTALLALNAAELDSQQATQGLIAIMSQWSIEAKELMPIIDKINITSDNFAITSQDLVDGLVRSSGAARNLGLSLEQTISLLTVMREASGRTGREVGNALNSILSYMQRNTAINTFEALGVKVFADEAKTQFRNVMNIFSDLSSNWKNASDEIKDGFVAAAEEADLFGEEMAAALDLQDEWNDLQRRDISQAASGVFRRNYFIALIERFSKSQEVLNNMMESEGHTMEKNALAMEALEKKNQSLKASVEALAVAMGDAGLTGVFKSLVDSGTNVIGVITSMPKPAQDLLLAFANVVITVKALQLGLKTFGIALPGITPAIASLTSGMTGLNGAIGAVSASLKGFLVANWPLLALAGLVAAVITVRNEMKRAREEAERFIEATKLNIDSLEDERRGLIELSKEYTMLKEKQGNLTATGDEKQRLIEIQRELVDLYGVSIAGIDAEGKAYADSTKSIQDRIKELERLRDLEHEQLQTAILAQDSSNISALEDNIEKQIDLQNRLLEKQKEIDRYVSIMKNKESIVVNTAGYSGTLSADHADYERIMRSYIQRSSQEKLTIQTALNEVNQAIRDASQDREKLLIEDATKIVTQLSSNGSEISDSARAFAIETAKALATIPEGILTLKDDLDKAIKEFISSDFDDLVDSYNKFMAEGDTKGIDQTSAAITTLVRNFTDGKPALDDFALAMESLYPNAKQLTNATVNASKGATTLSTSIKTMGDAAKKAFDELKTLNQVINDVKRGQSLTADSVLDLMDKYNLSADVVKKTADGYTIEITALENLRTAKIKTAIDGIEAEKKLALVTRDQIETRLKNYGLEIEQLRNLAEVKSILARQAEEEAKKAVMMEANGRPSLNLYDDTYSKYLSDAIADVNNAKKVLSDIEEISKKSKLLTTMLNDRNYGVSSSNSSNNDQLKNALRLLEHKKRMSEETVESLESEIIELNRINEHYVKTAEERMDIAERIYATEKRLMEKKKQRTNETFTNEEAALQHWAKVGVYSIQQQIDKYRELYSLREMSSQEQWKLEEQIFGLYKSALSEQQKELKNAYNERIKQIEAEAKAKKEAQEDIIKGIEKELELLNRQEDQYDHDKKMADLKDQLAYWQVRTSEDARKKVADILKQIDEAEHKREVELQKQSLEDKKKTAQDEIKAIDEAAKEQKENWEKTYGLIEEAFGDHSTNIIALAATMSKQAYDEWVKNYLIPLQSALANADLDSFSAISSGLQGSINGLKVHDWGMSEDDYNKFVANGDKWMELYNQGYKESTSAEMQKLRAENDALRLKYGRDPALGEYPEFHEGAKTLSYGLAMFKPGELVFPPDLSTKLEQLILALYSQPYHQLQQPSHTTDKRIILQGPLFNSEKTVFEDSTDEKSFARELQRMIFSIS